MPLPYKKPLAWFKRKPQIRKSFNEAEDRRLGESLKIRQLEPLVCLPDGTIICGERRLRGAELVGMTELEVKIIDDPVTEAEFTRLQFTENMQRQELSGYEQWQGCVELLRLNPSWTQKDLSEQLHVDPSMVTRLLSPSKCIQSVQAAFAAGKIGISDCYAISRLSEAEQAAALAMKLNGASRDQLASHARQRTNGDTPAVRVNRMKLALASGVTITAAGEALSLDELVEALGEAQKQARKAISDGLDARTFQAVLRDKAKAGR
jgi:ParB/RepB/Spo0J family partition protein